MLNILQLERGILMSVYTGENIIEIETGKTLKVRHDLDESTGISNSNSFDFFANYVLTGVVRGFLLTDENKIWKRKRLNQIQVSDMEHAIKNGAFYSDFNDANWNELVEMGLATKHRGWDDDSAYYKVTEAGKKALELTDYQVGKLLHCFGLDYSKKPYRNYYCCNDFNVEWEDLIAKGYAKKDIKEDGIYYRGTLKALRKVYRKNISVNYFEAI